MWLSEKSNTRDYDFCGGTVGIVTIGGKRPSVLVEGEVRNADIVCSGAVQVPKAGDEVLLIRSPDGENIAVGKIGGALPSELENGEIFISTGSGGAIRLKNNGEIELVGTVVIKGTAKIEGGLLVNGKAVLPIT